MGAFWDRLLSMFGGRRERPVTTSEDLGPVTAERDGSNLDQALPTLAAILDTLGEHAFELDNAPLHVVQQKFTGWARHVDEGAAPPERPAPRFRAQRDWTGLKVFVGAHRRQEKLYVTRTGKELREALWLFVQRLSHSFVLDKTADNRVDLQLRRLRTAIDKPSVDELKRQVIDAVDNIRGVVEERAARHRRELENSLSELEALREELSKTRRDANVDPLTRVYNRRMFDEQLRAIAATRPLTGMPATLLMVDIDHFKKINDSLGHPAGDEILRRLADCMVRTLPRKTDFIARYGGEEFGVIFQNDGLDVARMLADRLMTSIRALRVTWDGKDVALTVSIGLAEVKEGETAVEWLQRADDALYDAKHQGRDRVVIASAPALATTE